MSFAFSTFLTLTLDGISYGMMLFLISVGLTITLGVMRVVNLMHSSFAMLGGYAALWGMQALGLPYFVALVLGVLATVCASLLLERSLYQWVYQAQPLGQLLMTLGMAFVLTAVVKNLAGPQIQSLTLPALLTGQLSVGSFSVTVYRVFVLLVSVVVAGSLWLALEYTLSVAWAFAFAVSILLWCLKHVAELPEFLHVASFIPPGFTGMLLAVTCLMQFSISLLIDRRYEPRLIRAMYWIIWYPLVYWMLSLFTTLFGFANVTLRGHRRLRARWISPDRGIASPEAT